MLILAWHLSAVRMCEFTRPQWLDGLAKLGYGVVPCRPWTIRTSFADTGALPVAPRRVDTIDKLRGQLDTMRNELKDPQKLKSIYQFAFDFGKEPAQKSLRT